jgi:hypothetical protein
VLGSGATIHGRHGYVIDDGAQLDAAEIPIRFRAEVEARVERSAAHARQCIARHHLRELDFDLRIELPGLHEEIAHAEHRRLEDGSQLQLSGGLAAKLLGRMLEMLDGTDDLRRFGEEAPSRRREAHPGRRPLEQRDAEPFLEGLDVAGDGRLAQVKRFRSPGEVAEIGDGDESAKLIEIHGISPSACPSIL